MSARFWLLSRFLLKFLFYGISAPLKLICKLDFYFSKPKAGKNTNIAMAWQINSNLSQTLIVLLSQSFDFCLEKPLIKMIFWFFLVLLLNFFFQLEAESGKDPNLAAKFFSCVILESLFWQFSLHSFNFFLTSRTLNLQSTQTLQLPNTLTPRCTFE